MPTKCCVRGCSVRGNGHMFPRDEVRKKLWLNAIRRNNYKPSIYARVCKKHFRPEDYTLPKDSVIENPLPVLKKDAVPSVFNWNDAEDYSGETKQNVPKRKTRSNRQIPVRSKIAHKPVLKLPGSAQPIETKLMRVPNDPSLIARLERARKALVAKPRVSNVCNLGTIARSDAVKTFKPISSSFKCLAFDSRLKKLPVAMPQISLNLNIGSTVGYQLKSVKSNAPIPANEIILAGQSQYTVPIEEIKVEMDTASEVNDGSMNMPCKDPLYNGCILSQASKTEKELYTQADVNPTHCKANPDRTTNIDPNIDRIMREHEIKEEKDFVAVEIGHLEVEFESKDEFKDEGVQCNIGDPCCSISLRKEPQFCLEKYSKPSLKNFKKRRISV